jgi:hypothetical protein
MIDVRDRGATSSGTTIFMQEFLLGAFHTGAEFLKAGPDRAMTTVCQVVNQTVNRRGAVTATVIDVRTPRYID